jgi:hypothetical protein
MNKDKGNKIYGSRASFFMKRNASGQGHFIYGSRA